jgi:hypothetical protein
LAYLMDVFVLVLLRILRKVDTIWMVDVKLHTHGIVPILNKVCKIFFLFLKNLFLKACLGRGKVKKGGLCVVWG